MPKTLLVITLSVSVILFFLIILSDSSARSPEPAYEFNEVWGYLMKGEERHLTDDIPVTDVAYFSARISRTGKLYGAPDRKKLKNFNGRTHLVVASIGNYTLTHICINPEYKLRNRLISDIVKASEDFDGVQIDLESVIPADKYLYLEFLSRLKKELKGKTLSVAVPARRVYVKDAFDYSRIGKIADRVIIMAYDQHWSTSKPGPVSSLKWCSLVSEYALSKIPSGKIIMGIPFYGRAWIDKNPAKAYRLKSTREVMNEVKPEIEYTEDGIPFFSYSTEVTVTHYFDDRNTIGDKLNLYKSRSIDKTAFWRISQETPEIWEIIKISK